jgi:hypothetical protein
MYASEFKTLEAPTACDDPSEIVRSFRKVSEREGARFGERYTRRSGAWRSLVSALVWGTRGPEFKSRRPD